jgi:hypothetical protein
MKNILASILSIGLLATLAFVTIDAQEPKPPEKIPTKTTKSVWRPVQGHHDHGHFVHFTHRDTMKAKRPVISNKLLDPTKLPAVPGDGTVDWAKVIDFPMDLNDTYGDCYYACICHLFNTLMGNASASPTFSTSAIKSRYFALSGGDNGLGDSDVQGEMSSKTRPYQGYVADIKGTSIIDYQYLDTTNPDAVRKSIYAFGAVLFTLSVPDNWINNSNTGAIWDTSTPDPNNGHAVLWNGVDNRGYYKLQTWGSYVWITPGGVKSCDPSGWIVFSTQWYNAAGYAPNGLHITTLAAAWQAAGGKAIPTSVISAYPPPSVNPPPVNPPPVNPPTPGPTTLYSMQLNSDGSMLFTPTSPSSKYTRDTTLGQIIDDISGKKVPPPIIPMPPKTSQLDDLNKRMEANERMMSKILDAVLLTQRNQQQMQEAIWGTPTKAESKGRDPMNPYANARK